MIILSIVSDVLAVFGFLLLVDWKIIPEWLFVHFVQHKHGNTYTKLDTHILDVARNNKGSRYNTKRDANIKFSAFLSIFISSLLSLILDILLFYCR